MNLSIEVEQEVDGRWIAEILEIPGALAYGATRAEAEIAAAATALRTLADKLEAGEIGPPLPAVSFVAA